MLIREQILSLPNQVMLFGRAMTFISVSHSNSSSLVIVLTSELYSRRIQLTNCYVNENIAEVISSQRAA